MIPISFRVYVWINGNYIFRNKTVSSSIIDKQTIIALVINIYVKLLLFVTARWYETGRYDVRSDRNSKWFNHYLRLCVQLIWEYARYKSTRRYIS